MTPPLSRMREALLRFNSVAGFAPDAVRRMMRRLEASRLLEAKPQDLAAAAGVTLEAAGRFREQALAFDAEGEWREAARLGARVLDETDPEYPDLLKAIPDPPLVLYVRGTLAPCGPALAFVGSRRPTPYGRRMARALAGQACASGCVIVSGLARGIDTEAHAAALEGGGATWAVLGSGLGRIYPPENGKLAGDIAASGGCLISEFPLAAPPLAEHFPRRNRVVSGLSWGTVVVEGRARSGSLITARFAAEQGREVFAVPGPADSPLSDAPHRLIAQGAKLVGSMADVWEELPCLRPAEGSGALPSAAASPLSGARQKILKYLGPDSLTLEEIGSATGIDLPRLSNILFEMELEDLVGPVPGQRYAKKTA